MPIKIERLWAVKNTANLDGVNFSKIKQRKRCYYLVAVQPTRKSKSQAPS